MKKFALFAPSLLIATMTASASAAVPYFEGFEDSGWTAGLPGWVGNSGTIQRVPSGTNTINSAEGIAHASVAGSAYTQFGGYSSDFGTGFTSSIDVYLDIAWQEETGFDYTVAINNQAGTHLRDFMWHVGVVEGYGLLVNASSNTDSQFNSYKLLNENSGNYFTVATSGWYTLEQVFRDQANQLAVDFNLRDTNGALVYSVTRLGQAGLDIDEIDTEVGGNRYGWIIYNTVGDLAIDNTSLVPEPAALSLLGVGAIAMLRRRR